MKIIDVHAHYEDEAFNDDREEIINKCNECGIEKIINAGATLKSSKQAIELAKTHSNIYATIGIHPEVVDEVDNLDLLRKLYMDNEKLNKIVAIGEIGLDYHYTKENRENQKELFKEQLELAYELGLPVQIHSRDASVDTIEVLNNTDKKPNRIMFHCFDLNEQTAKYIMKKGYSISLGGSITYKRTEIAIRVIKEMPIDKIMTETDCPYLAPVPNRGTRNDSTNIQYVIKKIAEIKEMDEEELAKILYNNAVEFYNLQ